MHRDLKPANVMVTMPNRHPYAVTSLATADGRLGRRDVAETLFRKLTERGQRTYVSFAQLICPADAAGHRDLAMDYARRSWTAREPTFVLLARNFPEWAPFRADPCFQSILREMNAPLEDRGLI